MNQQLYYGDKAHLSKNLKDDAYYVSSQLYGHESEEVTIVEHYKDDVVAIYTADDVKHLCERKSLVRVKPNRDLYHFREGDKVHLAADLRSDSFYQGMALRRFEDTDATVYRTFDDNPYSVAIKAANGNIVYCETKSLTLVKEGKLNV